MAVVLTSVCAVVVALELCMLEDVMNEEFEREIVIPAAELVLDFLSTLLRE
jgi:hypothetical protein